MIHMGNLVGKNRGDLCVCYNIDSPEKATMSPLRVREGGPASTNNVILLNMFLLVFFVALSCCVLSLRIVLLCDSRVCVFLRWKTLSKLSLEARQLHIPERSAQLGAPHTLRLLNETNNIVDQYVRIVGGDGTEFYQVKARLAMLDKNYKLAELYYMEQVLEMYQELHMWDDCIAEAKLNNLRHSYYQWLMETNQHEKVGEVKEGEEDFMGVVNLYLKVGLPVKAARFGHEELVSNSDILSRIAAALIKGEFYERGGDLFEKIRNHQRVLDCYHKGHTFRKVVELARVSFPTDVVKLEEDWVDYLVQQKQMDAAINHYIEAGCSSKTIEAAVGARQWKAVHILELQEDRSGGKYYLKIAQYYASSQECEIRGQSDGEGQAMQM
uniref:Uncharacterized protein n=1 Tax=Oncorhynchus tshawytscha TaxID=74940 RepID=A0A8C8H5U9_ONCTS